MDCHGPVMETLCQINSLLNQPNTFTRNLPQILFLSHQFVTMIESNDSALGTPDDLRPILATIGETTTSIPIEADVVIATILKMLLRKSSNRLALGKHGMSAIIRSLNRIQGTKNVSAAAEMCNVILNTCYDTVNVQLLIELDGMIPLLKFLKNKEVAVLCSSLGALQGLCYVPSGRQCLRQNSKALFHISKFLEHEDSVVRARAVGVIHNLSVDAVSIAPILDTRCVPVLVSLMRDSCAEICRSAAGTIQNLARDPVARDQVVEGGALEYLSDLLFASDITCQVTAVGTILNIVGSQLSNSEDRLKLQEVLTDGLVLGAVRSCVFENN